MAHFLKNIRSNYLHGNEEYNFSLSMPFNPYSGTRYYIRSFIQVYFTIVSYSFVPEMSLITLRRWIGFSDFPFGEILLKSVFQSKREFLEFFSFQHPGYLILLYLVWVLLLKVRYFPIEICNNTISHNWPHKTGFLLQQGQQSRRTFSSSVE